MIRPDHISIPPQSDLESFWHAQQSPLVRNMLKTTKYFALSDLGVRIIGERGTGKLFLSRMIHRYSSRCDDAFTSIDCGELGNRDTERAVFGSEVSGDGGENAVGGILEGAQGGTLYLDKYPLLPEKTRFRLSRAQELRRFRRVGGTQDIPLNLRIITGITKHTIHSPAGEGEERNATLGISPVSINIPPLRERREDIASLIYLFLSEYQRENSVVVKEVTSDVLDQCLAYSWPGNIHELRNVVRHSSARCREGRLEIRHLPDYIRHEYSHSGTV